MPLTKQDAQGLFDRAIARGVIGKFILVAVDMNTPLGPSWYTNSPVTGNWEDFAVRERRDSRGLLGDRIGGYGAIRIGMRHPEVFGAGLCIPSCWDGIGHTDYACPAQLGHSG
jgi:hypothetical protein